MEKIYITPKIKVREIDIENSLLDTSLNGGNPTSGLPDVGSTPIYDGTATGGSAGSAGSKFNSWAAWGSEEED